MTSEAHGKLVLLVWSDNGVIKPLVLDSGAIPVTETTPLTTIDTEIKACAITLPVAEQSPITTVDVDIKTCAITLPVAEQSPLEWLEIRNHTFWGGSWRHQPVIWGFSDRWVEYRVGTSVGDATTESVTIAVPAGYTYVLEGWHVVQNDTVARSVDLRLLGDGIDCWIYQNATLGTNVQVFGDTRRTMKTGDTLRFRVTGLANTKTCAMRVWGVKLAIS